MRSLEFYLLKFWHTITFRDRRERKLMAKKFEQFKKRNAVAIKRLQPVNGRIVIPCIWHPKARDWIWVNRSQRRKAELIAKRSPA